MILAKYRTKYGYFTDDGKEYVITTPLTPMPWVNVVSNGDWGFVVTQNGSGYSWLKHASLNRITRWEQDLITDEMGKYIYIRDNDDGSSWSATYKPVCRKPAAYEVRHAQGYSTISSLNKGIRSRITYFCPKGEAAEIWLLSLKNESGRKRNLSIFSYLEWCLGAVGLPREFHKIFLETSFDKNLKALFATNRLWTIPDKKGGHWNRSWDYMAFHGVNSNLASFESDREAFIGMDKSIGQPQAIENGFLSRKTGKWGNSIASLMCKVNLLPQAEKTLVFVTGAAKDKKTAARLIKKYKSVAAAKKALGDVKKMWSDLLSTTTVETPDEGFNFLNNTWLKYQSISARQWGRCGYSQPGAGIGFRDQLQDSQVFLYIDPKLTQRQIIQNAEHQFKNGTVCQWWHPITEESARTKITDSPLWLVFITLSYFDETDDFKFLKKKIKYVDGKPGTLFEHCNQAIEACLRKFSRRGLPLIGGGDWNDGLNNVGLNWKGESIWLAHFLYGILKRWSMVCTRLKDKKLSRRYELKAELLKININKYAWDGSWYIRATRDDGGVIGSVKRKEGKIFLNAQTWAIINKVVPDERLPKILSSMKKFLYHEYGPVLFNPAYSVPDKKIGYLTRYAPGMRENGGLYMHAGCWAVMAECRLKNNQRAFNLLKSMFPVDRGKKPDLYKVEPFITPGNVDGPDSENYGRGGYTWYTGSATWLNRVCLEWILGIRPVREGLLVDPCIPKKWKKFKVNRLFRGTTYIIDVENKNGEGAGVKKIKIDGKEFNSNIIPAFKDKKIHKVKVVI